MNQACNSIIHLDVGGGFCFFTFCTKNSLEEYTQITNVKQKLQFSSRLYNLFQIDIDNQVLHRCKIVLIV